jgi:hypothetical protein
MNIKMNLHISPLFPLKGRINSNLLSLNFGIIAPLRGLGVIITTY